MKSKQTNGRWWKVRPSQNEKTIKPSGGRNKETRYAKQGCKYCTFNTHYNCVSTVGGCKDYLWNGKNPTKEYCDDCAVAATCEIKRNRDLRGIKIDYCGLWKKKRC